MDEGRKRVLLIAAAILAARKLAHFAPEQRAPASIAAIEDAICWAERIMAAIDRKWPKTARTIVVNDSPGQFMEGVSDVV